MADRPDGAQESEGKMALPQMVATELFKELFKETKFKREFRETIVKERKRRQDWEDGLKAKCLRVAQQDRAKDEAKYFKDKEKRENGEKGEDDEEGDEKDSDVEELDKWLYEEASAERKEKFDRDAAECLFEQFKDRYKQDPLLV